MFKVADRRHDDYPHHNRYLTIYISCREGKRKREREREETYSQTEDRQTHGPTDREDRESQTERQTDRRETQGKIRKTNRKKGRQREDRQNDRQTERDRQRDPDRQKTEQVACDRESGGGRFFLKFRRLDPPSLTKDSGGGVGDPAGAAPPGIEKNGDRKGDF